MYDESYLVERRRVVRGMVLFISDDTQKQKKTYPYNTNNMNVINSMQKIYNRDTNKGEELAVIAITKMQEKKEIYNTKCKKKETKRGY